MTKDYNDPNDVTDMLRSKGFCAEAIANGRCCKMMPCLDHDDKVARFQETYGAHPNAVLEVVKEGDKIRIRVREPTGKASIFMTGAEIVDLAQHLLQVNAELGRER